MGKFLERTAKEILAKHGNNLSDVLVLFPNQRSCTYFRNELKKQATQAIFSPEISTLQNWMLTQSDLILLDDIELVAQLFACYKEIGGTLSLDEFIGIANVLLDDFDELDIQLANAKLFFKNLEMLQSMKIYEPGEQLSEYKLQYRKFWEDFGKLYFLLREKLFATKNGYRGMILRHVAENINDLPLGEDLDGAVYLIGFSNLNKCDAEVGSYLQKNKNAEIIWDADTYYVRDEMNEAGSFFRKHKLKFKINEKTFSNNISVEKKNIEIIGAAKNIGQVKVAADILQNKLQLDETTLLETAVIVPDEKLLSPLIANLPANITSLNITMGLTIAGSNPATFLEILFRLNQNSQKYQSKNRAQRFYYKDVFDLLQHNYSRLLFGNFSAENFIERMKNQNRILIRREELIEAFEQKLNSVLFESDSAQKFAEHLHNIISLLLDKLIKHARAGNASLAADTEITFRLLSIIANTKNIFSGGETLSVKTYIALLKENFRNTRVPLEGDPVQGLQIMGLQETRSLDFKNVIILSANEGILPSGKSSRSYIPYEMQREFLSTYKERDSITAYLFYRLLHRAENVFVLYNTEPDELGGGEKSRFILQLQHELPQVNLQAKISDKIFAVDPPPAVEETEILIEKNENVLARLQEIFSSSGISPSALNTYINCSLQYYFRYIARLREEEDMEENIEAATIGSAVHFALEKIYSEKINQIVSVEFIEAQLKDKQRIENLVREHLSSRFDNESLNSGKNLLLFKVCVKLTEEFLKHEKKNIQQLNDSGENLQIELLEEELKHEMSINNKQIKIAGRVDRIERVGDTIQIADYKTSKYSSVPILNDEMWDALTKNPEFSKPVQLLVYAWLYTRVHGSVPIRSGIYWLRESKKSLDALRIDKENDVLNDEIILRFEEKLKNVLGEILNEKNPFSKTTDVERCVHCDFKNICGR